jgi:hypothetical protein
MCRSSDFIDHASKLLALEQNVDIIEEAEQVALQASGGTTPSVETPIAWMALYGDLPRPSSNTPFTDWIVRRIATGDVAVHMPAQVREMALPLQVAYVAGALAGAAGNYEAGSRFDSESPGDTQTSEPTPKQAASPN